MTENEAIKILSTCKGCMHLVEDECISDGCCFEAKSFAIGKMYEIQKYHELGTVEECRNAMEKQMGKKIKFERNFSDNVSLFICDCGKRIQVRHDSGFMRNHDAPNYCPNCGQRIEWSDSQ